MGLIEPSNKNPVTPFRDYDLIVSIQGHSLSQFAREKISVSNFDLTCVITMVVITYTEVQTTDDSPMKQFKIHQAN